jgi:peptide/nickel transport system permease protein
MSKFILRRMAFLIITILLTSLLVFLVTQWLPGDVCRIILGREAGGLAIENCRQELGLDQPLPTQYLNWLGNFLRGDWGISFSTNLPIFPMVMDRLQNSLVLAIFTLIISIPIAVTLGVIAGLNANKPIDNTISIGSLAVVGLPEFVTGLVLIQIFSFGLRELGLPRFLQ